MAVETLPSYSVRELNQAIGNLLSRGFAPRFLLEATVSKAQLKKGHLWLTLSDGKASITGVVWSSQLKGIKFRPVEGDGVFLVAKLNFWEARANLAVQILDMRPSISTVLRKFEVVRDKLITDGLIDEQRRRPLPAYPKAIAILTSIPSSAHADMLRTAKERWPLTRLVIMPIPVQGEVQVDIQLVLQKLSSAYQRLGIEALILARGGGSREDLMVFDSEALCRDLACFPIPVVTGIGHEDDLTVVDLVADHRSATPTAAIVDLLPSIESERDKVLQKKLRLNDFLNWILDKERRRLIERRKLWEIHTPLIHIQRVRTSLRHRSGLLDALSPQKLLLRGFSIVTNLKGETIKSVDNVELNDHLIVETFDGNIETNVQKISLNSD